MWYSAVGSIVMLVLSLLTTPHGAEAQQTVKVYRIGVLSFGSSPPGPLEAFTKELNEFGYVEGRNLAIAWRFADGSSETLAAQADELVRLEVDAIFAVSTPAAQAAKRATTAIPIVIARVADPVQSGLVPSIARPGGNITGLTSTFPDLGRRRLELLKEALPGLARVAVMWNPRNHGTAISARQMEVASQELQLQFHSLEVQTPDDILGAFQAALRGHAGALAVIDDVFIASHKRTIVKLAAQHTLPLVSLYGEFAEAGALMIEHHVHRPVEEVHAVADPAETDERSHRQHVANGPRCLQPDDQECAGDADERERALVRGTMIRREQHDGNSQREQCDRGGPRPSTRHLASLNDERGEHTGEDLRGPRRGGPVGRVRAPHRGDDRCRDDRSDGGDAHEHGCPAAIPCDSVQHHESEREEPVELLLDREGPVVLDG